MEVKVYHHLWENGESMILHSKEFGWMEFFDNYDLYSPLVFKSKTDLICNKYNASTDKKKIEMFKKGSAFNYLGKL